MGGTKLGSQSDNTLTGYRIYTRTDEQFLGYQLWQEVDALTKQWSFSLGSLPVQIESAL